MVKIKPITLSKILRVIDNAFWFFLGFCIFYWYLSDLGDDTKLGQEIQQGIEICEEHSGKQCMPMIVEIK